MIAIDFHWENPGAARGPELRATWSRFQISVDGNIVTQILDESSRSVRPYLYGPLYPLAEWIAYNWHRVLYCDATRISGVALNRVDLAGEGFALPRLSFSAQGSAVFVQWMQHERKDCRLQFLSNGAAWIPIAELRNSLRAFVKAVITRLEEQNVCETKLAEEWKVLESLDDEEEKFCAAAATMGLDPFDLSDEYRDKIIEAAGMLPEEVFAELLPVTQAGEVNLNAIRIANALDELRGSHKDGKELKILGEKMRTVPESTPWDSGYSYARQVRSALREYDPTKGNALSLLAELLHPVELKNLENISTAEGAIIRTQDSAAIGISRRAKTPQAKLFVLGRLLGESINPAHFDSSLVTRGLTDRQKFNRAFAAEFLAPSELLKTAIPSQRLSKEDVVELAESFHVSEWVIEHQLMNHQLATVITAG